jgi:predicted RNase H-like HicB family nuclease
MLTKFLEKKLKQASYKLLKDGTYFGEIQGLKGVWANTKTLEACREELRDVLEEWVLLKVRDQEKVPGLILRVRQYRMPSYA